jgi:hypothetical protein
MIKIFFNLPVKCVLLFDKFIVNLLFLPYFLLSKIQNKIEDYCNNHMINITEFLLYSNKKGQRLTMIDDFLTLVISFILAFILYSIILNIRLLFTPNRNTNRVRVYTINNKKNHNRLG